MIFSKMSLRIMKQSSVMCVIKLGAIKPNVMVTGIKFEFMKKNIFIKTTHWLSANFSIVQMQNDCR